MFAGYFSPLAPAAILLLGAFVLSNIFPRLPRRWQTRRNVQYFGAPALVGLAGLSLLGTRLTFSADASGAGQQLVSGWNFSSAESAATLSVRADGLGLAFLSLTFLILLAVMLAYPLSLSGPESGRMSDVPPDSVKRWVRMSGWLAMGAAACLLFVAANGLTIGYAVFIFDLLAAIYWLRRGETGFSVARLFLGVFTASGLVLIIINATAGILLFGLALWLRLGFYPFFETSRLTRWPDDGPLAYAALSLAVGLFLAIRGAAGSLPMLILWLTAFTMLLSGLLAWLAEQRAELLLRMVTTVGLSSLLGRSLAEEIMMAFALGLILSLAALWVTPGLGKPRLSEGAWSWPYLPALGATLTLIGLPWLLTWPVRSAVYQSLFQSEYVLLAMLSITAEALALSGLVRYWMLVWQVARQDERHAVAGVVIMVPFLIPGLAPFILATITKADIPTADFEQPWVVLLAFAGVITGAVSLGYYRSKIIGRIYTSHVALRDWVSLTWLRSRWEKRLMHVAKFTLRIEVFLEGQHYVGWALFTALVGILIVLLGR